MINVCTISLFQEENLDQILKIIGDLKEIGNKLYKDKDFKKAKLKYKKAIRFVYKLAKIKSIWLDLRHSYVIKLFLCILIFYIKQNYNEALQLCGS